MYNTHNCSVRIVYDNLLEDEAFEKEKELIAHYRNNTKYRLTNMTDGGDGVSGWKPSQEFKDMQSKLSKARWQNEEYKKRIIDARHDPNSTYQSDEFKNKISKLVSGTKNPNYANHWTEEQKQKLSELRKSNGLSKGTNNVKATSIICLETGEVFELIKDAMQKYNVKCEGSFSVALKIRSKTAASYHWMKYKEELLNPEKRFYELLISLTSSNKNPIICVQTKELFYNRKEFLKKFNIGIDFFQNNYKDKITIDKKDYMYVKDYLQVAYTSDCI